MPNALPFTSQQGGWRIITYSYIFYATIWFIVEGQNQIIWLAIVIVIITSALLWLNTSDDEISEDYMYSSFEDLME